MKKLVFLFISAFAITASASALNLQSRNAIVIDRDTGTTLYEKGAHSVAPIASVTKLMTAMVVLDDNPDMKEVVAITIDDVDTLKNSTSRLPVGAQLTRKELLNLALMSSENRAAHALARTSKKGLLGFVLAMNAKAVVLGMTEARFVDPTGLSPSNRASATDLGRLVEAASNYPAIREYTSQTHELVDVGGRMLPYKNTNRYVGKQGWDVLLSKTGYIQEAGRCVVMGFKIAGRNLAVVLMGANSSAIRERDLLLVRNWVSGEAMPAAPVKASKRLKLLGPRQKTAHKNISAVALKKKQGTRGALLESGKKKSSKAGK